MTTTLLGGSMLLLDSGSSHSHQHHETGGDHHVIIAFNVGGGPTEHMVTMETLNRLPGTLPQRLALQQQQQQQQNNKRQKEDEDEDDGLETAAAPPSPSPPPTLFIDADPDAFLACLRYLRTGTFVPPAALSQRQWMQQVEFLGFSSMVSFPLKLMHETDLFMQPVFEHLQQMLLVMQDSFTDAATHHASAPHLLKETARYVFSQSRGFRYRLYPAYFMQQQHSSRHRKYATTCDEWLSPPDESFEQWMARHDHTGEPEWNTLRTFLPRLLPAGSSSSSLLLLSPALCSGRITFATCHPVLVSASCPTGVNDASARLALDYFIGQKALWVSCRARFDALWTLIGRLSLFLGHVGMDAGLRYLRESMHSIALGWNVSCTQHSCLDPSSIIMGADERGQEVLRIQPVATEGGEEEEDDACVGGGGGSTVFSLDIYM